jgi:hypothetical protein
MKHPVAMLACLALVACSNAMPGPTGATGPAGAMGAQGATGPAGEPVRVNVLMRGSVDCPTGGVELVSVDGRRVVCNGATGSADGGGLQGPPGRDGTNGTNGMAGMNGLDGISVTIATEQPGMNCPNGGISATGYVGPGLGNAGIATRYVCNGAAGSGGGAIGRFPDGGNLGAILFVGTDGGLAVDPRLTWEDAGVVRVTGDILFSRGAPRTIGIPPVDADGGGTNLTIRAGGRVTTDGNAFQGGVLELRAGNANVAGSSGCPDAGPQNNSVKIYAGDNVYASECGNVNNGDIEFYAGNNQPEVMRIVGDTGNVGIGTSTPSQRLHVIGNILASGTVSPSDARLKENIHGIERSRELLRLLHGVHYTWNKEAQAKFGTTGAGDVGLLAQDVQKVVPEAVVTLPDGTLTVNYDKVVPLLVEALKAQDEKLRDLEQTNARLKALERRLEQLERH